MAAASGTRRQTANCYELIQYSKLNRGAGPLNLFPGIAETLWQQNNDANRTWRVK